jgi:hypothetical protein
MARNAGHPVDQRNVARAHVIAMFRSCKMAVRFYKELHNLSTADFLSDTNSRGTGKYYEVERIISKRILKGKVSDFL